MISHTEIDNLRASNNALHNEAIEILGERDRLLILLDSERHRILRHLQILKRLYEEHVNSWSEEEQDEVEQILNDVNYL